MVDSKFLKLRVGKSNRPNVLGVIVLISILSIAIIALAFGHVTQHNEIRSLESQIWDLEKASLHRIDFVWINLYPEPYINFNGIIFNSGTDTAYSVVLTVRFYDYQDALIKSEDFQLANILGKDYETFDYHIYCQNIPDHVITTMDWEYYT